MPEPHEHTEIWKYKDRAAELTAAALNHYFIHKQIVLKKLKLAQNASVRGKRLIAKENAKGMLRKLKVFGGSIFESSQKREGNVLWNKIIDTFSTTTVYEDDLFRIEALLEKLPKETYQQFLMLSNKDRHLKDLQNKLNTEEYLKNREIIAEVQKHKNPLTQLDSDDYGNGLLRHLKELILEEE